MWKGGILDALAKDLRDVDILTNNAAARSYGTIAEGDAAELGCDSADQQPLGTPEGIAYSILWMASDEASFITGTILVVDRGLTAI
jgi:hypothetical protein